MGLTRGRASVNTCWMNKWMNEKIKDDELKIRAAVDWKVFRIRSQGGIWENHSSGLGERHAGLTDIRADLRPHGSLSTHEVTVCQGWIPQSPVYGSGCQLRFTPYPTVLIHSIHLIHSPGLVPSKNVLWLPDLLLFLVSNMMKAKFFPDLKLTETSISWPPECTLMGSSLFQSQFCFNNIITAIS